MNRRSDTTPLNSLAQVLSQEELLDDPEVRKLVLAAGLTRNEHLRRSVSKAVLSKSVQYREHPFSSRFSFGDIQLGETFQDRPFHLTQKDLNRHLLAVGQSGSGKTTLFYSLMNKLDKPFWTFDLKQDYRHLARQNQNILVLPWTELRFNPLQPPSDVPPRRWAQVFVEILGHATALLSGSKNYLLKRVIELYKLYGLFDEVSPPYPSLHELKILIKQDNINYTRKASNYRDTVLNRLESMNLVAGTIFDCSQGYPIEELLNRDVVFEFDGLSRDVQNFLMEILFACVYEYRVAQNHRDEGLNHVFFLDEGKRVFSVYKERQDAAGIPEIDELTAKMREFGGGLVVADQEASKLTDSIKANTYTKVLLPTGDRKQFDAVASSMDLSERQKEFASKLGVGEAIVQVGSRDPVPVNLDNYELEKDVSDEQLRGLQSEKWDRLSYEPREMTSEFENVVAPGRSDEVKEPEIVEDPVENFDVSDEGRQLLKDVIENPFRKLTERYTEFPSRYKGNMAKDELLDKGILVERHVQTKDSKRKLLQLTEQGRKYAQNELDLEVEDDGRGGIVHRYWQHRIRDAFEKKGWHAFVEKFDADVYVNMGNAEMVVEVAMGNNPREVEHVKQHLDTGFDAVWIVARNQEILDGLKRRLEENNLSSDCVAFRPLRQFNEPESLAF
ncbi:MAG: ATP-binding protein [Halobacteriales archaeon]|nr:ATP-binding protein [Halobacteriales archaeon]